MQGEEKGPHSGCPRRSRSLFLLAEQTASAATCVLFSSQKADQKVKESSHRCSQEWPGASQAARGMRKMSQHSGGSALAVTFSLRSPESSFHSLHPCLRALLWVRDVLPTPKSLDLVKGSSAQRRECPQRTRFSWLPSAAPGPPNISHLAEVLLDSLGFCAAGSHGAAQQAQAIPGFVQRPHPIALRD